MRNKKIANQKSTKPTHKKYGVENSLDSMGD